MKVRRSSKKWKLSKKDSPWLISAKDFMPRAQNATVAKIIEVIKREQVISCPYKRGANGVISVTDGLVRVEFDQAPSSANFRGVDEESCVVEVTEHNGLSVFQQLSLPLGTHLIGYALTHEGKKQDYLFSEDTRKASDFLLDESFEYPLVLLFQRAMPVSSRFGAQGSARLVNNKKALTKRTAKMTLWLIDQFWKDDDWMTASALMAPMRQIFPLYRHRQTCGQIEGFIKKLVDCKKTLRKAGQATKDQMLLLEPYATAVRDAAAAGDEDAGGGAEEEDEEQEDGGED